MQRWKTERRSESLRPWLLTDNQFEPRSKFEYLRMRNAHYVISMTTVYHEKQNGGKFDWCSAVDGDYAVSRRHYEWRER